MFRYLDLKSLVPSADQEKYILDQIETLKHDKEIDDETSEEYDIIFYINPKLLEQLTGGYGIRPASGSVNTGIVNKVWYNIFKKIMYKKCDYIKYIIRNENFSFKKFIFSFYANLNFKHY